MTEIETRAQWHWLKNTYWYCPTSCMPALQINDQNIMQWAIEQTVWHIQGYKDGFFWGIAAVLITPAGQEPKIKLKQNSTLIGSITPQGEVLATFITQDTPNNMQFSAPGRMTEFQNQTSFEMQVSAGPDKQLTLHWAYMKQITPDDPQWQNLPGAGVSMNTMLRGIENPSFEP